MHVLHKTISSNLVTIFLLCNRYRVYLLMNFFDKRLTHLSDATLKKIDFILTHMVFNLTME